MSHRAINIIIFLMQACNNTLLAITMIGLAEVAHLGSKLGLDPKVLMSVVV